MRRSSAFCISPTVVRVRFSLDSIRFFEGVVASMGMAFAEPADRESIEEERGEVSDEPSARLRRDGFGWSGSSVSEAATGPSAILGDSEEEAARKDDCLEITFTEDAEVGMAYMRA